MSCYAPKAGSSSSSSENKPGTSSSNREREREGPPDRVSRNFNPNANANPHSRHDLLPRNPSPVRAKNQYVRSKYVVPYVHGISPKSFLTDRLIKDLTPRQRALKLTVIYLDEVMHKKTLKDNISVYTLLVADTSGSVHFTLFGDMAQLISPGDILTIYGAHTTIFGDKLILKIGTDGAFERTGDFCMLFKEIPFMSAEGLFPGVAESLEQEKMAKDKAKNYP